MDWIYFIAPMFIVWGFNKLMSTIGEWSTLFLMSFLYQD